MEYQAKNQPERDKPASNAERFIGKVRYKARKKFSAEEKIRIVLEGMKREISIAELCRREGIASTLYYNWAKSFLEAGKSRLSGDTLREAGVSEVKKLKQENDQLKKLVGEKEFAIEFLKKNLGE